MRKILLFVTVLAGTCTGAWAQLRTSESSSRLLDECRTLFTQGDYSAAGSILEQWSRTDEAKGLARDEEIDFMRVVIQAENDLATAMPAIQIFMSEYPSSMYNNRLYALMGSSHFALHEYEDAIESFEECDPLLLDSRDCLRMVRHKAISLFRCYVNGRTAQAREGFENSRESRHADEAGLYLAEMSLSGGTGMDEAYNMASEQGDSLMSYHTQAVP